MNIIIETVVSTMLTIAPFFAPPQVKTESIISPVSNTDVYQEEAPQLKPDQSFGSVLGAFISSHQPTPTPLPPTPAARKTKKARYSIALLGDSMIDTLGPSAGGLDQMLRTIYPSTSFLVYNFGVGGYPIFDGIQRITNPYIYDGETRLAMTSVIPDVVVVESFAYNPFGESQTDLARHADALEEIVQQIKYHMPNTTIFIMATIAPNDTVFGDGAPHIAFDREEKIRRTHVIRSYLENTLLYATSHRLPIIDVYHPSLDANGNGKLVYINNGDHIHYSPQGRQFVANHIAQTFIAEHVFE